MVMAEKLVQDDIPISAKGLRWSVVSLSEVYERQLRLEASVFDIEGKHAREVLNRCKWDVAAVTGQNSLATAYNRPRFKRIFVDKSDYPIYQPSQLTEIYPKPRLYISIRTNTDIDALRVRKNQILVTCSGTIGKCTIVTKTLDNCIFSHDVLRVTAKHKNDTGYIYAYLKTKIGQTILQTNNYGAVIQHIEPEHLEQIPIPNPSPIIKLRIHDLIMDSFQLRDESNELIDNAERLLIEELHLPSIEELEPEYFGKEKLRSFSVKVSNLEGRLEATYHTPIVSNILSHISKYASEVTTLGDPRISRNIILPGRFKRVYVEAGQGMAFFGGKQLLELDPSNKKYLSLVHHGDRIKNQLLLKENMIVITSSGTIGKVNILPKHWGDWTLNQHVIRIVPIDKSIAGYIYTWLNTDYAYELIRRFTYGAVIHEIDLIITDSGEAPAPALRQIRPNVQV